MAGFRLHPDPAAMGFYQSPTYQESQTSSFNSLESGFLQSVERLKDFGLIMERHACSLVGNADNQMVFLPFGEDSYLAALGRIFSRIFQEIMQYAFHSQLVGLDRRKLLGQANQKPMRWKLLLYFLDCLLNHALDADWLSNCLG